ncbi:MAG: DUF4160 domain-containing protein [Rhizobium sp.]
MPTIVRLGNIAIRMFANDHNPPHFHIVTADYQISVLLSDFSAMAGSMDRKSLSTALEWAAKNKEVLENEWKRLNP